MKPGKELDILVANAMGLIPCEDWRAVEWDGIITPSCYNEKHIWSPDRVCYATGIRESNETLEKSGNWVNQPVLHSADRLAWNTAHRYDIRNVFGPPPYSTSIQAIWEVVEKLFTLIPQQDLHFQHLAANQKGDDARWGVGSCHWKEFIYAETLPHAVCLATLKFYDLKKRREQKKS